MAPTLFSLDRIMASYGVSSDDLRLYERRGLLQPVPIDGTPCYTARDRIRLEVVLKGLRLGFSLDEVAMMILGSLAVSAGRSPAAGLDKDSVVDELRALLKRQGCSDVSIEDLNALLRRK